LREASGAAHVERASGPFDLTHITKTYFWDFEDELVINSGWCFVWAWMAHLHYPELHLVTWENKSSGPFMSDHAVVRDYEGLWYDSSQPLGTEDPLQLSIFEEEYSDLDVLLRDYNVRLRQTRESFMNFWGGGFNQSEWGSQGLRHWPRNLDNPWL